MSTTPAQSKLRARLLVVDDHPMLREGLRRLIDEQCDMVCCGEAGTAADAQAAVEQQKPDLVILDLRLGNQGGLELIKSLKARFANLRILVLSQYESPMYVERALRAGAVGYVIKELATKDPTAIFPLKNPALISMTAAFVVGIVVSWLTREPEAAARFEEEKVRTYLGVGAE